MDACGFGNMKNVNILAVNRSFFCSFHHCFHSLHNYLHKIRWFVIRNLLQFAWSSFLHKIKWLQWTIMSESLKMRQNERMGGSNYDFIAGITKWETLWRREWLCVDINRDTFKITFALNETQFTQANHRLGWIFYAHFGCKWRCPNENLLHYRNDHLTCQLQSTILLPPTALIKVGEKQWGKKITGASKLTVQSFHSYNKRGGVELTADQHQVPIHSRHTLQTSDDHKLDANSMEMIQCRAYVLPCFYGMLDQQSTNTQN